MTTLCEINKQLEGTGHRIVQCGVYSPFEIRFDKKNQSDCIMLTASSPDSDRFMNIKCKGNEIIEIYPSIKSDVFINVSDVPPYISKGTDQMYIVLNKNGEGEYIPSGLQSPDKTFIVRLNSRTYEIERIYVQMNQNFNDALHEHRFNPDFIPNYVVFYYDQSITKCDYYLAGITPFNKDYLKVSKLYIQ